MNEIETLFCKSFIEYVSKLKNFEITKQYQDKIIIEKHFLKTNKSSILENEMWFHISDSKETLQQYCFLFCNPELKNISIHGYKPDFIIVEPDFQLNYAIEIDGHEWHEKTKEQAIRDKQKEREYLKEGFIPIRFTGSEVYHDVLGCIKEVLEIMCKYPSGLKNAANNRVKTINASKNIVVRLFRNNIYGFDSIRPISFINNKYSVLKNVLETCNKKYFEL